MINEIQKGESVSNWHVFCMTCKYFEQGKSCSFCGHPDQTDKELRDYLYYSFTCSLWTEGVAQSRLDYMKSLDKK